MAKKYSKEEVKKVRTVF